MRDDKEYSDDWQRYIEYNDDIMIIKVISSIVKVMRSSSSHIKSNEIIIMVISSMISLSSSSKSHRVW